MSNGSLSFTKLGTVKSSEFEYTYEDFFRLINNSITRDIDNNGVFYDDENDCYTIVFKEKEYQVKHGKDIINKNSECEDIITVLDELIELTDKQKRIVESKKVVEQNEKEKKEDAIANGKKGIFNSDEDKRRYIEYLKGELKKKKRKFLSNLFEHKRFKYTYLDGTWRRHFIFTAIDIIIDIAALVVYISVGGLFTIPIPFIMAFGSFKVILDFLGTIFNIISYKSDGYVFDSYSANYGMDVKKGEGIFYMPNSTTLNMVITLTKQLACFIINTFSLIKNVVSNLVNYNSDKRRINKQIKALEKLLLHSKSKGIENNKTKIGEIKSLDKEEEKTTEKKANDSTLRSIKELTKEFRGLKEKILRIEDKKKKEGYSKELLDIMDNYKKMVDEFEEKGTVLMVYKNVLDQIISLTFRVEETLNEEKKRKEVNDEFNRIIDEIDSVSNRTMRR